MRSRIVAGLLTAYARLESGTVRPGRFAPLLEAALPGHLSAAYRAALARVPPPEPLPGPAVAALLAGDLGADWHRWLPHLGDEPESVTRIAQVHRGRRADGRAVLVRVRHPDAAAAVHRDAALHRRLAGPAGWLYPGADPRALAGAWERLRRAELDHAAEARHRRALAVAYAGDPEVRVARPLFAGPRVLVTEDLTGRPLDGALPRALRDEAGRRLVSFLLGAPRRAGVLPAEPEPAGFRVLDDGRLGVLDPGPLVAAGPVAPALLDGLLDPADRPGALRRLGVLPAAAGDDPLGGLFAPAAGRFTFTPDWLRGEVRRLTGRGAPALRLPAGHLPAGLAVAGAVALLCRLEATVDLPAVLAA